MKHKEFNSQIEYLLSPSNVEHGYIILENLSPRFYDYHSGTIKFFGSKQEAIKHIEDENEEAKPAGFFTDPENYTFAKAIKFHTYIFCKVRGEYYSMLSGDEELTPGNLLNNF